MLASDMSEEIGLREHKSRQHRDIIHWTELQSCGDACLCVELTELTRVPDVTTVSLQNALTSLQIAIAW